MCFDLRTRALATRWNSVPPTATRRNSVPLPSDMSGILYPSRQRCQEFYTPPQEFYTPSTSLNNEGSLKLCQW